MGYSFKLGSAVTSARVVGSNGEEYDLSRPFTFEPKQTEESNKVYTFSTEQIQPLTVGVADGSYPELKWLMGLPTIIHLTDTAYYAGGMYIQGHAAIDPEKPLEAIVIRISEDEWAMKLYPYSTFKSIDEMKTALTGNDKLLHTDTEAHESEGI